MRFKERSIALGMTVLFLCMPITQAVSYGTVDEIFKSTSTTQSFKVKLTEEQIHSFNEFIGRIPSVEDKETAKGIFNRILSEGTDIDINRFGELLGEYGFENVSKYQETTDIVDDVLDFIMDLIIERLGWVDDLLEKTSDVLYDAQRLWQDRSLPKEMINEIGLLIENLKELQNLATLLIEGRYVQFLRAWSPGIIIEDITEIIESIETIVNDVGILTGDISKFISDMSDLIGWFSDKPWERPIHVYGRVMQSTKGLSNVTIRCKEMTSMTDEEGNFSFFVNATPDDHSIPPNVYYGIHQCIITAENNGVVKEVPVEFSYVFSDGDIYWLFLMDDDDSVQRENIQNVLLLRTRLLNMLCSKNDKGTLRQCIIERCLAWSNF
jgi:hypothetical protein